MVRRKAILIAAVLFLLSGAGRAQQGTTGAPRDPKLTAEQRADALLRQMTVEEKAMQLSTVFPVGMFGADGPLQSELDGHLKHGIGHVAAMGLIGHKTPEQMAKLVNAVQRYLVTQTRLKIPAIFHNEAMSGVVSAHFTQFPTSIELAATWDPAGTQEMADLIRRQMRAVGQLQALSPVLDIARDARWGRVSETYGEDPYLVSALGVAYVRGLQGKDLTKGVLATAKHFVGYAVTEGGQNMAATAVGARELYDVHARPFEAAFRLAGLASVMPSYSEFDGVPISASKAVLTDMLRTRMGFTGTAVSDYVAVSYNPISQVPSELTAIGAPTQALWARLGWIYTVLITAFGIGVWKSAGGNRALRLVGGFILAHASLGLLWPFAPMHQREVLAAGGGTPSDTLHQVLAAVTVFLMFLAIGFGATAFGGRFRLYSIVTIVVLLVFGGLTFLEAPRLQMNLPTPWIGLWERINISVFLMWVVVLAAYLCRPVRGQGETP